MKVRSNWNYDRDLVSLESSVSAFSKTRTQQNFKEQCDINRIVKQFAGTGELQQRQGTPLSAEEFVGVMDYHTAMNAVRRGDEAFMALDARTRERFDNDPGAFVDFCLDPSNLEELRKMGLAIPAAELPVAPVEQSSPVAEGEAQ